MSEDNVFADFIRRVRAGDEAAAEELVRRYGQVVRTHVRAKLHPGLRRKFDSLDICQMVQASFFRRKEESQYGRMGRPEDLVRWLLAMARNKLKQEIRELFADKRDVRHEEAAPDGWEAAGGDPSPSEQAARRELLEEVRRRFSEEERQMLELRNQGCDWDQVARRLGGTPRGRRKQWQRAQERVTRELDPQEECDG
jgi:RNA polymerase sigma-70 factor (ECF subfamily)